MKKVAVSIITHREIDESQIDEYIQMLVENKMLTWPKAKELEASGYTIIQTQNELENVVSEYFIIKGKGVSESVFKQEFAH